MYDWILFDLDGTLTDPGEGITNAVAHALRRFGLPVPEREKLYPFIGPPLTDSFMKYYGLSPEEADQAVIYYREHFRDIGIFENEVYPGIPEMLQSLVDGGKKLALATSKPEEFAKRIMDRFDLAKYFSFIGGAEFQGTRTRKGAVIAYVLESCGITDKSRVLMVGDREHDVLGARENGLPCMGVLFGYGDLEELENAGAALIAETVAEVGQLILAED